MMQRSRFPGYADMPAFAYCAHLVSLRMRAYRRSLIRGLAHGVAAFAVKAKPRRTPSLRPPFRGG